MEFEDVSVRKALDASILAARHLTTVQAGLVAEARRIADTLDREDFPMVEGRFDNVSGGLFLKYCEALGLAPSVQASKASPVPSEPEDELAAFSRKKGRAG